MLELQHCNCSKCCYASRDHPTRNTLPPHRIETPAQSLLWLYCDFTVTNTCNTHFLLHQGPGRTQKNTWISPRAYVHVLIYCTTKKRRSELVRVLIFYSIFLSWTRNDHQEIQTPVLVTLSHLQPAFLGSIFESDCWYSLGRISG